MTHQPKKDLKKVEEMNRPLAIGERYLVPCIVRRQETILEWRIVNGEPIPNSTERFFVTPVINHPHNDVENGQPEAHYHIDYRFLKHAKDGDYPTIQNKHSRYYFGEDIRPQEELHGELQYLPMPVINAEFAGITPVSLISKTKLKHRCIHKGKCPHRGFDMAQVPVVDGVIKCPLHGLQFDAKTGKLLNKL